MANRENNNFDFFRLIAAVSILYGHAFVLYDGSKDPSFFGYDSISNIALSVFFVISGYLITSSYINRGVVSMFLLRRFLRIIPGISVVLLISAFILGPVLTKLSLYEYFGDRDVYRYLLGVFIFPLKYSLPGVIHDNPYPNVINGSLWSLKVEVLCYLMIAVVGKLGLLEKRFVLCSTILCFLVYVFLDTSSGVHITPVLFKYGNFIFAFRWILTFLIGSVIYLWDYKIDIKSRTFVLLIILDLVSWYFIPFGKYFHIIISSYIIIYMCVHTYRCSRVIRGLDMSYGVYIYAFPIQQIYMHYIGSKYGFISFVLLSILASFICGYFSWKFVEKPFMSFKPKNIGRLSVSSQVAEEKQTEVPIANDSS